MVQFLDPISQLPHTVIRLECVTSTGATSFGTGYFFSFCRGPNGYNVPCIVTNKHVVQGAAKGIFRLTIQRPDQTPDIGNYDVVELNDLQSWVINHPSPSIDLAAIPLAPIFRNAAQGHRYHYVCLADELLADDELLDDLGPIEDIVMIGYPNGLWDSKHNMPIIRRGITGTHPRFPLNGKAEFLIDAACFPGSSGSPVFLANIGSFATKMGLVAGNRIRLLGTLYAGPQFTTEGEVITVEVPTDTKAFAVGAIPMNLGLVIQAAELKPLEEAIRRFSAPPSFQFGTAGISRTAQCPCNSGKRFKDCCGALTS